MPNIIRIRNLENETNINGGLIFPVDYSGDTINQGYTSNIKRIDLDQIKEYVLFDYTGSTSGTSGTSGTDGSSGLPGVNGTSGISPCHSYQSNIITISYSQVSSTSIIITNIPKIESNPISTPTSLNNGVCYITPGTIVTFSVTGLTGYTDYSYEWYLNDNLVNLGSCYSLSSPNNNDKIYVKQITCNNVNNIMVVGYCSDCNSGTTGTFRYRNDTYNSYLEMCMQSGSSYLWTQILKNSWIPTSSTTTTTIKNISTPNIESVYLLNGDIMISYSNVPIESTKLVVTYSYDGLNSASIVITPIPGVINIGAQNNYTRTLMYFWLSNQTYSASVPLSNMVNFDNSIPATTTTTTTSSLLTLQTINLIGLNLWFNFDVGSKPVGTLGNQFSTDGGTTFTPTSNQGSGISPRDFGIASSYPRQILVFRIYDYTNLRYSNTLTYNNVAPTTTTTTTSYSPISYVSLTENNPTSLRLTIDGGKPPYTYTFQKSYENCQSMSMTISNGVSYDENSFLVPYSIVQISGGIYHVTAYVNDSALPLNIYYSSDLSIAATCLIPTTLITMFDNSIKMLSEINIGDKLLTIYNYEYVISNVTSK